MTVRRLLAALALSACAPTLTLRDDDPETQVPTVSTTEQDGLYTTEVDASSYDSWVYFSFQSGTQVLSGVVEQPRTCPAEAESPPSDCGLNAGSCAEEANDECSPTALTADAGAESWDLAFQRFHILSNGGVSGSAGVALAEMPGMLADGIVCPSPNDEDPLYEPDAPDGDDDNALPDNAFNPASGPAWYDYDDSDNSLHPRETVYCVHTAHGTVTMQLTDYYNAVGGSGHPQFQWQR